MWTFGKPGSGDCKSRDVPWLCDNENTSDQLCGEFRASVVLLQPKYFQPMAAVVFERPGDEPQFAWPTRSNRDVSGDSFHLLGMSHLH